MSDAHGVARDQLRSFIERVERLSEEKKTIEDDIKDVYGEAKAMGYCVKTMKKIVALRKIDDHKRTEEELKPGMWVGVGSVCKRQGDPRAIMAVLQAIAAERPDLLLHGFGVKITSLVHPGVRALLATADSMAWSFAARKQGRDANDWREADRLVQRVRDAANQNH